MAPQEKDWLDSPAARTVEFHVNRQKYVLTSSVSPHTRLIDFIRDHIGIKGTKVLCREGGCGACTVVATVPDLSIEEGGCRSFSVQACQVLVYACSGWSIETIESIGNRHDGYHTLQKSLVGFYGTQCGYCSPGMIMTMYGELKRTGTITKQQVEQALDGNICRCTGYRPILDAFKALAVDAEPKTKQRIADIEEVYQTKCPKSSKKCSNKCGGGCDKTVEATVAPPQHDLHMDAGPVQWYQPLTLRGLYSILKRTPAEGKTLIVAGNTGAGVFKDDGPYSRYVSLGSIKELQRCQVSTAPLEIGARVSLTRCIELFQQVGSGGPLSVPGYRHLVEVADHWQLVANLAVRNNGSWAGNLVLKNSHPEFPSDIFVTLVACGATLTVADVQSGGQTSVNVADIATMDMSGKVILSMIIPTFPDHTYFRSFKITPRAVNAHAYVNAALRLTVDARDNFKVTATPAIVFGGLGPHFISATDTERFLLNKYLNDIDVVNEAIARLKAEVTPEPDPHQGSVEYRKDLVLALFYKTVMWLLKDNVSISLRSTGDKLTRGLSTGQQDFDANTEDWPVGQAIPKVESSIQVSGEAEYADDIQPAHGELHGAFVQTDVANARIDNVDATAALAVPGVVSFVSAADIVGVNTFFVGTGDVDDKVFATDRSHYAGQSVGVVVATSRAIAVEAVKLVRVTYSDKKKPVLTIRGAIDSGRVMKPSDFLTKKYNEENGQDANHAPQTSKNRISGDIEIGTQFHFQMEPLSACVVPMEDGYNVSCTTQHINEAQSCVARVLAVPANSINMEVRRLGGGFGGKITRAHILACAAAVAAHKMKKPVRITLDLRTHMTLVGWRDAYYSAYEIGFDDAGKLEDVRVALYCDAGFVSNEASVAAAAQIVKNAYASKKWLIASMVVKTDTAANTWCRTPGHVQGLAVIENIMDHVASYLNLDPLAVREANLSLDQEGMKGGINVFRNTILPLLKEKAAIEQRKQDISAFNKENRWRKRGLSVIPLRYRFNYPPPFRYTAHVIIYAHDGTVAITHGGIEMGQGINTKAAQVAAKVLGVPLETIKVKPTTTVAGANSFVTGGSFGTDLVCHGIRICCERLHARIEAVKTNLAKPDQTWPELIKSCLHADVDLSERYWTAAKEHPAGYTIWAGACMEVELDVLTGQFLTRRADIIEDVGRSISPFVDVGQIEGAFVMGLGLFTTELLRWDEETGKKNVTGTWEYKPPTALDIPEDFRVTFLPNAANPFGVLGSKATGEPPLCLSYGVVAALRQAVKAARADAGVTGWFAMYTPMTVEKIQQLCLVKPDQFALHTDG